MLRREWYLSAETQVSGIIRRHTRGLAVQDAEELVAYALGNDYPHPLTCQHNLSTLVLSLNVEYELRSLAAPQVLAQLKRWDGECVWVVTMRLLAGAKLPEITRESGKSHSVV